ANVVIFSMALGNGDFYRALELLVPMSAYFLGTMLSEILATKVKKLKILRWDTILVGFEIPLVIIMGFIPASMPDQICQVMLNFVCSMQFNTFRQNEGIPMATTFVTNHIRQTGSNFVKAVRDKDPKASLRWKAHGIMIIYFIVGAVIATALCRYFNIRAIWGALPFLIYGFIRLLIADRTYEKDYLEKIPRGHKLNN
nr:DUF1275 domain-containing protein [Lachnospiraceae bacterium]